MVGWVLIHHHKEMEYNSCVISVNHTNHPPEFTRKQENVWRIRVIGKVPQTGAQFHQNQGWNEMSGWKQYTGQKQGGPNKFSHLNCLSQEFHPQFWICITRAPWLPLMILIKSSLALHRHLDYCSYSFLNPSLVRIGCCKSSELMPSFMKWFLISYTLLRHSIRGSNRI
jgi:hypothetical protein